MWRHHSFSNSHQRRIAVGVLTICLSSIDVTRSEIYLETFDTDPMVAGRLVLFDGEESRFSYDAVSETLTASYDTILPTARLIHQLQESYNDEDDFEFEFDIEILSAGFFAILYHQPHF